MRARFGLSHLLPDLVALVVGLVLGDLLDWWDLPHVGESGATVLLLLLIWVRLAFR